MDGDSLQCCQAPAEMDKPAIIPFINDMFIKQNFGYFGKKLQFLPYGLRIVPNGRQICCSKILKFLSISILTNFAKDTHSHARLWHPVIVFF